VIEHQRSYDSKQDLKERKKKKFNPKGSKVYEWDFWNFG